MNMVVIVAQQMLFLFVWSGHGGSHVEIIHGTWVTRTIPTFHTIS